MGKEKPAYKYNHFKSFTKISNSRDLKEITVDCFKLQQYCCSKFSLFQTKYLILETYTYTRMEFH